MPYLPNINKYGIVVSDMTIKPKTLNHAASYRLSKLVTDYNAMFDSYESARLHAVNYALIQLKYKLS
jgi:hypothetical protein